MRLRILLLILLSKLPAVAAGAEQPDCEKLAEIKSTSFRIIDIQPVPAREALPAHCRLHGRIAGAVNFELRLPHSWNGKFLMVGNGGYLGIFFDQSYGLSRGFTTASTDTGHTGPDPRFAFNNREAEIDFAHRAVHATVIAAKEAIEHFYGRPPEFSYFRGCSTGGRQGLMEAQRFPEDFDGWSIGAPIYDYTDKQTYNASWVAQALFANDRQGYVPHTKLKSLGSAVYARCDETDGLRDGLIDDPRNCDFDAERDLPICPDGTDRRDCFTAVQIAAIEKIYAGPGDHVYPGHVKGGEWLAAAGDQMTGGWDTYITGRLRPAKNDQNTIGQMDRDPYGGDEFLPVQLRNAISFFKYLAFEEDRPEFDVLRDLDFANVPDTSYMADMMNADDPDLSHIGTSGKKILLWHGWADVGLIPLRTIQYYKAVQQTVGKDRTDKFLRLFMVPGMYHCEGGPGPDIFDDLAALESWVERAEGPERMIAYKTSGQNGFYPHRAPRGDPQESDAVLRSRPLCRFPLVARYNGQGSLDEAQNFRCVQP